MAVKVKEVRTVGENASGKRILEAVLCADTELEAAAVSSPADVPGLPSDAVFEVLCPIIVPSTGAVYLNDSTGFSKQ